MMVPDPEERMMRSIARDNGIDLIDVERVKDPFFKYDTDKTGITEQQFSDLICDLLKTDSKDFPEHRMKRHWREVNPRGGKLSFRAFAVWWNLTYKQDTGSNQLMTPSNSYRQQSSGSLMEGG